MAFRNTSLTNSPAGSRCAIAALSTRGRSIVTRSGKTKQNYVNASTQTPAAELPSAPLVQAADPQAEIGSTADAAEAAKKEQDMLTAAEAAAISE